MYNWKKGQTLTRWTRLERVFGELVSVPLLLTSAGDALAPFVAIESDFGIERARPRRRPSAVVALPADVMDADDTGAGRFTDRVASADEHTHVFGRVLVALHVARDGVDEHGDDRQIAESA